MFFVIAEWEWKRKLTKAPWQRRCHWLMFMRPGRFYPFKQRKLYVSFYFIHRLRPHKKSIKEIEPWMPLTQTSTSIVRHCSHLPPSSLFFRPTTLILTTSFFGGFSQFQSPASIRHPQLGFQRLHLILVTFLHNRLVIHHLLRFLSSLYLTSDLKFFRVGKLLTVSAFSTLTPSAMLISLASQWYHFLN